MEDPEVGENPLAEVNGNGDLHHTSLSRAESEGEDGELSRLLMNSSGSDDEGEPTETPADVCFARTKKDEQAVLELIQSTKSQGSNSIDLSKRRLQSFPEELLELSQIEYMYLEGNDIGFLPDEFFKHFPHLTWLDLRYNQLSRIPSIYLSNHTCLRSLLLEGNNLRNLPLELGLVKSLHGLNIALNPLDFPPQEIISKGTQGILAFLREMLDAKNTAKMGDLELTLSEEVPDGFEHVSASSDDWNTTASMMELAKRREFAKKSHSAQFSNGTGDHSQNRLLEADEHALGAKSAELHRPALYAENKYQHIQKLKKAGALGVVDNQVRPRLTHCPALSHSPSRPTNNVPRVKQCLKIAPAQLHRRKLVNTSLFIRY